nr:M20/M25/M40 family metallo-hydrolase [Microbacterium endophyticum]
MRIPTVSHVDEEHTNWSAFAEFAAALERLYPATHAALSRETVDEHSLLYRWRGRTAEESLVLMAHMDVVPVVAAEWDHDPFGATLVGAGDDATIHARGAIDDKGALVGILEAVESLVSEEYVPAHDIYLAFGHNEETAGGGARALARTLKENGIRPALVLDEGGAVVDGAIPGISIPTAMVGVAERGIMTVVLTARESGGHASTPLRLPATARLARAITRLSRRPFHARISPPVRAMFRTLSTSAPGALGWAFRHIRLTAPLVALVLSRLGPEMNATVRTTAVVTELSGAPAENVLATTARASVNVRILTGETVASVRERMRRVIADPKVEIDVRHDSEPSPISPWRGEPWRRIATAVATAIGPDVVTTPYLQSGATDSRWFTGLSENVYRFAPFHLSKGEREALHSHNERIRVESWLAGVRFYRSLMTAS